PPPRKPRPPRTRLAGQERVHLSRTPVLTRWPADPSVTSSRGRTGGTRVDSARAGDMMQQDFGSARFTRRDAIRVLAAGTGLGALPALTGGSDVLAGLQRTGAPRALTRRLPRGSIIRTLLRDVPPEALGTGAVLFHE